MSDISTWTIRHLKDELRMRGVPLRGKTAELLDRLTAYQQNENSLVELALETVLPDFYIPIEENFRDVNTNTKLPAITRQHVDLFFNMFDKKVNMAEAMYEGKYLGYLRYCRDGGDHFLKGLVHAQLYKKVAYGVNIKIGTDGRVEASHCDCAAGKGGFAHCKHVGVVLLGALHMVTEGRLNLRQSCIQQLQSLHQPKRAYEGSPLKSNSMLPTYRPPSNFDPRPIHLRNSNVQQRLHNLCASFHSSMPFKHLLSPANPYAVEWDHLYSKTHPRLQFLKSIYLYDVSDEDVIRIERETLGQHLNPLWQKHRKYRLTASNFYDCCNVVTADAARALATRLLTPLKIKSDALTHSHLNKPVAVNKFMKRHDGALKAEETGLYLMKSHPYIGASPDRKMGKATLLEVKCPFTARNCLINPSTVPYLVLDASGNLSLDPTDKYMYQVLGQLAVTGRDLCDFIVYTYNDLKVVSIPKDLEFISVMLKKLQNFYEKYFLSALLDKYYHKYYDQYCFV